MLVNLLSYVRAAWHLRGYRPKKVTLRSINHWVKQFPREYREYLLRLLANVRFVSEEETIRHLLELNAAVLRSLEADGVPIKRVIYVTTDTAASSSEVMLNLLRDRANLERRGARIIASRDAFGIQDATKQIGTGAIIYVDDFAGSGKQFTTSRNAVAQYAAGVFSEFFLLPCICEEALSAVEEAGVVVRAGFVHRKSERPLHEEGVMLEADVRERVCALSKERFGKRKDWMGFGGLATNVVFYRNAPNNTPLIFRGHLGQRPCHGVIPRADDLEVPSS